MKRTLATLMLLVLCLLPVLSLAEQIEDIGDLQKAYDQAVSLVEKGRYSEAKTIFAKLGNYSWSALYRQYIDGQLALRRGAYDEALAKFEPLSARGFLNSTEMLSRTRAQMNGASAP